MKAWSGIVLCTAVASYIGPSEQTRQARQPSTRQTEESLPAEYPGHTADPQNAVQFHAILYRYIFSVQDQYFFHQILSERILPSLDINFNSYIHI